MKYDEIWEPDIPRYQDDEIKWKIMYDQILEPGITRYKDDEIWGDMQKYEEI